jgi:hypothetical protein
MKKILYVILHTCTRPDRHDGIVNSWGKDVDYIFYADCDNEEKKIVKVSDDSTYSSNEPKHINVIKYLIENDYQYDWFFFCDDDTFVNTKRLENNLENIPVAHHEAGSYLKILSQPTLLTWRPRHHVQTRCDNSKKCRLK